MKVPPTCDLPVYEETTNPPVFFRTFARRLKRILEEMAQAVNANDTRDSTDVSTGDGSIKMNSAANANNSGWIEMEENKWIPYWTSPDP